MTSHLASFLEYASVLILMFFTLEMLLLVFAFGPRLLGHFGYTFDLILVGVIFYLQVLFDAKAVRLAGVLRLWRLVRIINTILSEYSREHDETRYALEDAR